MRELSRIHKLCSRELRCSVLCIVQTLLLRGYIVSTSHAVFVPGVVVFDMDFISAVARGANSLCASRRIVSLLSARAREREREKQLGIVRIAVRPERVWGVGGKEKFATSLRCRDDIRTPGERERE